MTKCYVVYEATVNNWVKILCFICAVRAASEAKDPTKDKIKITTTNYEYHQCDGCGELIEDTIEI